MHEYGYLDGYRRQNNLALQKMLAAWANEDELRNGTKKPELSDSERNRLYGQGALKAEAQKVRDAPQGDRNNQLFRSVAACAELVAGGALSATEVEQALTEAALAVGLERGEVETTIRSGLRKGSTKPRTAPAKPSTPPGEPKKNADNSDDPLDQDATAADLILMSITVRWVWPLWVPQGVLTILASEPGCGKTRFCMDLARRLALGMPWPDGSPNDFGPGMKTLWVPADNQHTELGTIPVDFGFPPELLVLNATRRNPFVGTLLDAKEELADFEARIARHKPVLVFVDTCLNATDRSSHKPEDAKAFFVPLQQIAARQQTAIVCVTHLNAAGKPLGRRIMGQGRLVMQIEKPDPDQETRRKLYVVKSNSLSPRPLGVTLTSTGNDYDDNPPSEPDALGTPAGREPAPAEREAQEWLLDWLADGPKLAGNTIGEAERAGIPKSILYVAKAQLKIKSSGPKGQVVWELTTTNEGPV